MVEGAPTLECTKNDEDVMVEDERREARRLLFKRIRRNKTQGIITNFCKSKSSVGGNDSTTPGGGVMNGGKVVEQTLRKTTGTSKSRSKTKGTKLKRVGNGKAKKMGPKSSSGKEPEQAKPDSSQTGILDFFGRGASPVEIGNPMGIKSLIQIPAGMKCKSSVLLRPLSKKLEFMTRDCFLEIKRSETG